MRETGYTTIDSQDLVDGAIEFVKYFEKSLDETKVRDQKGTFSFVQKISRELVVTTKPYGLVAAMTPQNAPLLLELAVILNAIAAGNNVIVRPSSQCMGTARLLEKALKESFPNELFSRINIVSCKATDFLAAIYKHADLFHYIGSSTHGKAILQDGLKNNLKVLVDGEGSSTVVIDSTFPLKEAVDICFNGIVRCNGELCSSIRLIVIPKDFDQEFCNLLAHRLKKAKICPLFSSRQVQAIKQVSNKYKELTKSIESYKTDSNLIKPVLFKLGKSDTKFLNEGLYGPAAGVASYSSDEWKRWLTENPYPLNDCVLSHDKNFQDVFIKVSRAPRIVINHDPTIESVFEPWGAYLPSGSNDVSFWYEKYRKKFQIDKPV